MPKAARARVASPPAGAALVPQQGSASQAASEPWTRMIGYVTITETGVNVSVTRHMAGFDPAIDAERQSSIDHRVKPGGVRPSCH